jgi:hypothetical protein
MDLPTPSYQRSSNLGKHPTTPSEKKEDKHHEPNQNKWILMAHLSPWKEITPPKIRSMATSSRNIQTLTNDKEEHIQRRNEKSRSSKKCTRNPTLEKWTPHSPVRFHTKTVAHEKSTHMNKNAWKVEKNIHGGL